MSKLSLLGIPNDDNSSYLKGPSEAPDPIRRELHNDAYSLWSETGVDLGAPGRLVDHANVQFDSGSDPWDLIEAAHSDAGSKADYVARAVRIARHVDGLVKVI